jgi:pantetheine hydrolase
MARNNSIYVVADMGDIQSCSKQINCPSDGFYQFNTAVIFDESGNLVAKYHKMHLFGEIYYDLPPKPELVAINTRFGRLGIQICFDMIYKTPGVYLSEQMEVDTILFPTWWFDELPFLTASQYQQSWAITNKVNLLAANIQKPEVQIILHSNTFSIL